MSVLSHKDSGHQELKLAWLIIVVAQENGKYEDKIGIYARILKIKTVKLRI